MAKAATKKKTEATRKATLPEELDGVEGLDEEARQKLVDQYLVEQREKMEARLKKQVENFEKNLDAKHSSEKEIIIRKILIARLGGEIKVKREKKKELKEEIKEIKAKARAERKAKKEGKGPNVAWKSEQDKKAAQAAK